VRPRSLRIWTLTGVALVTAAIALPAALLPLAAQAAPATSWSALRPIDHGAPLQTGEPVTALACPTASLCVAAGYGDVETTTDPLATHHAASGWQLADVDGSYPTVPADPAINSVSCPSASLCVAVDSSGNVVISKAPTTGLSAWTVMSEAREDFLHSISCPTTNLCVAVGQGPHGDLTLASTDPSKGAASKWVETAQPGFGSDGGPIAISCPTASLCVAAGADDSGISSVWTSTNPGKGATATWHSLKVGSTVGTDFLSVSCVGSSLCVAAGEHGQLATTADPSSGSSASWHNATVAADDLVGVSCASSSLCVAVDTPGTTYTTTDPTSSTPSWNIKSAVVNEASAIDCPPAATFCVLIGGRSLVLTSSNPAMGSTATWTTTGYTAYSELTGVSCPSVSFCAAADGAGNVSTSHDPGSSAPVWTTTNVNSGIAINPGGSYLLEGISCPSSTLCVAVDNVGNVLTSTDPGGKTPTWTAADVDHDGGFTAITCRSTALCVGVDFDGDAVVSTDPTGGASAWSVKNVYGGLLVHFASVSCPSAARCFAGSEGGGVTVVNLTPGGSISTSRTTEVGSGISTINGLSCPTVALCLAADSQGNIEEATKPTGPASGWKKVKIDVAGMSKPMNDITAVSCSSTKHCVAVDAEGNALSTSAPTGLASGWKPRHIDLFSGLNAVACPTASLCVAVDDTGNETTGRTVAASLSITPKKLPAGRVGTRYHKKLSVGGGTKPYHWKKVSGALPAGLTLTSKGIIHGKPKSAGKSTFTVRVTDSAKPSREATKKYRIVVHKHG
jgi:hypothetical protein